MPVTVTTMDGKQIKVLVDPTDKTTLLDLAAITVELKQLLGIEVDVLTPKSLPEKFRDHVIGEALLV